MEPSIDVARRDDIVVVTLANPRARNALSTALLEALNDQFLSLMADSSCRAIVLTGAGEHFCAGGDVSAMSQERPVLGSRQRIERAHRVLRHIVGGPKPVIAAVEGFAFGAGMSLAIACDYVVSSTSARYAAVFGKVGLIPDMGSLWTLPQRIGLGAAKKLFVSCRTVEAAEAHAIGMVDQLAEPGYALETAMGVARLYADAAPLAVALTKAAYAKGCVTLEDALRTEVELQPMLYQSRDHLAAVEAFREKKAAEFKGV